MISLLCLDISKADRSQYAAYYKEICEERRRRADRYRFFDDRKRCVFSEILLRYAYTRNGGNADEMCIEYRKHEKPYLSSDENFHFNLSHSGNMIALAYSKEAVGVDIEKADQDLDQDRIADMIFTDKEQKWLAKACDTSERNERFFRLWTAKESYLKYLGTGFGKDAKSFSVDMEAHRLQDEPEKVFFMEKFLNQKYVITVCGKTDLMEYESLTLSDLREN